MNKPLALLALSAMFLIHTGCERHPASQTVPGYAEKQAAKEKKAEAAAESTERVNPNPPSFFPSPSPSPAH